MKIYSIPFFIIFFLLIGCNSKSIVPKEGIIEIKIISPKDIYDLENIPIYKIVDKKTDINEIVNHLLGREELVKFYPDYQLEIIYNDTTIVVSVKGHYIKSREGSYKSLYNLTDIIENLDRE